MNSIPNQQLLPTYPPEDTKRHEIISPEALENLDSNRLEEIRQVVVHDALAALEARQLQLEIARGDLFEELNSLTTGSIWRKTNPYRTTLLPESLVYDLVESAKDYVMAMPAIQSLIQVLLTLFHSSDGIESPSQDYFRRQILLSLETICPSIKAPFLVESRDRTAWLSDNPPESIRMVIATRFITLYPSEVDDEQWDGDDPAESRFPIDLPVSGNMRDKIVRLCQLSAEIEGLNGQLEKVGSRIKDMDKYSENVRIELLRQKISANGQISIEEISAMSAKLTDGVF